MFVNLKKKRLLLDLLGNAIQTQTKAGFYLK